MKKLVYLLSAAFLAVASFPALAGTVTPTVQYPAGTTADQIAKHEAVRKTATFKEPYDPDPNVRLSLIRSYMSWHGGGDGGE